jgi:hypothetical protein
VFDWKRGVFWLIAAIVATHLVIALMALSFCMYYGQEIVEGKYHCDPHGRAFEILEAPFGFFKDTFHAK